MIKTRTYLAGLALAGMASAAYADLTVTPAVVSDYDFRGITQSAKDPALQVGVDWSTGPVHLGAWTSNIDFSTPHGFYGSQHTELDLIGDYSFGSDQTVKYNTGIVYYLYPGQTDNNTPEVWFMGSKGWFSATLHYSWDWFSLGNDPKRNEWYAEANGTWPIGGKDSGFGLTAHYGYNGGEYFKATYKEFADYSIGLTKSLGNFNLALKYISNDGPKLQIPGNILLNAKRAVFSVSTTLPWSKE